MSDSGRVRFQRAFSVSRETMQRLEIHAALLKKWNPRINLVSDRTLSEMWDRHFADSAQILGLAPVRATRWADLGSGGGFPGVVLAILAAESRSGAKFTLIESDTRKVAFMNTVLRETGVDAKVLCERIEVAPPQAADVVTARALAPLDKLIGYAHRHLSSVGVAIFPKGANAENELKTAVARWRFRLEKIPSSTDPSAVILKMGDIQNV